MQIKEVNMVLLVVDTQRLITNNKLYKFDVFVKNVKTLINQARVNGIEVIYVRHDDGIESELSQGTDGFEIFDEFKPVDGEIIFDKVVNSSFNGTGLLDYLNAKHQKTLIVVGLQTDYCIDATVKCGFEHGFRIIVPEYANTTFDNEFMSAENSYKYYNNFIWNGRYAECVSIEETLKFMEQ